MNINLLGSCQQSWCGFAGVCIGSNLCACLWPLLQTAEGRCAESPDNPLDSRRHCELREACSGHTTFCGLSIQPHGRDVVSCFDANGRPIDAARTKSPSPSTGNSTVKDSIMSLTEMSTLIVNFKNENGENQSKNNNPNSGDVVSTDESISSGALIGIILAFLILCALAILVIVLAMRKKKRANANNVGKNNKTNDNDSVQKSIYTPAPQEQGHEQSYYTVGAVPNQQQQDQDANSNSYRDLDIASKSGSGYNNDFVNYGTVGHAIDNQYRGQVLRTTPIGEYSQPQQENDDEYDELTLKRRPTFV